MRRTTRWTYVGLALALLGLLAAGAGAATHVDERRCATVQTVVVEPVGDRNIGADIPRVNFSALTATEQQVFEAALRESGTVLTKRGALDPMVVRYQGDRYAVQVGRERGCTPFHRDRVVAPLVVGVALFGVGTVLIRGRDHGE